MIEQYMIIIIIPLLVAVLAGTIVSLLGSKKWGTIVAIVICVLGIAAVVVYLQTNNDEEIQHEKFSIPPFEYKIGYDMKRADILKLWENKNETLFEVEYKDQICIQKSWVSLYGIFSCEFEDEKLIRFYWTRVKHKQAGKYVNDIYEEKERIVKALETYYGEKETFKEKGNYYWKQENCVITLSAEEDADGVKYYLVNWYEPNYFYENYDLE